MIRNQPKRVRAWLACAVMASCALHAGCDSDSGVKETLPTKDAGGTPAQDGGPGHGGDAAGGASDGGPTDCVQNPQTHDEIINGCTDAVKLAKTPTLPMLLPDGGLPPLP